MARVKAQIRRSLIGGGNRIPDDSLDFTGLHINLLELKEILLILKSCLKGIEFS